MTRRCVDALTRRRVDTLTRQCVDNIVLCERLPATTVGGDEIRRESLFQPIGRRGLPTLALAALAALAAVAAVGAIAAMAFFFYQG